MSKLVKRKKPIKNKQINNVVTTCEASRVVHSKEANNRARFLKSLSEPYTVYSLPLSAKRKERHINVFFFQYITSFASYFRQDIDIHYQFIASCRKKTQNKAHFTS